MEKDAAKNRQRAWGAIYSPPRSDAVRYSRARGIFSRKEGLQAVFGACRYLSNHKTDGYLYLVVIVTGLFLEKNKLYPSRDIRTLFKTYIPFIPFWELLADHQRD